VINVFESIRKKIGTFVAPDPLEHIEEQHVLPREEGYNQTMELATSSHEGSTFKFKTLSPGRSWEDVKIDVPGGIGSSPTNITYAKKRRGNE
jgi:hypothetical protein